jgi:hypothetical protein
MPDLPTHGSRVKHHWLFEMVCVTQFANSLNPFKPAKVVLLDNLH